MSLCGNYAEDFSALRICVAFCSGFFILLQFCLFYCILHLYIELCVCDVHAGFFTVPFAEFGIVQLLREFDQPKHFMLLRTEGILALVAKSSDDGRTQHCRAGEHGVVSVIGQRPVWWSSKSIYTNKCWSLSTWAYVLETVRGAVRRL